MASSISRFVHTHLTELATVVTASALIVVLASNLIDLQTSQTTLGKTLEQQKTAVANNAKVEAQLEMLASGTQELANSGNANAAKIVEALKQNGISINAGKHRTP